MQQEQDLPNVGQRIRLLRERRGLSLRALAERCGLSVNAISRIERGEHSPTVASLHLLATALRVPITDFFQESSEQQVVLVRHAERLHTQQGGMSIESLGIGLRDQQLQPFLVTLAPGAGTGRQPITHAGQEFVYCIEGTVHYRIGPEDYLLAVGDSLLFEAAQPHCFENPGSSPAQIVLIFQAEDSAHLASHLDH